MYCENCESDLSLLKKDKNDEVKCSKCGEWQYVGRDIVIGCGGGTNKERASIEANYNGGYTD